MTEVARGTPPTTPAKAIPVRHAAPNSTAATAIAMPTKPTATVRKSSSVSIVTKATHHRRNEELIVTILWTDVPRAVRGGDDGMRLCHTERSWPISPIRVARARIRTPMA